MTTITIDRAVVEQTLEALESVQPQNMGPLIHPAKQALRAALAQQAEAVEPVAWMYTGIKQDGTTHGPHLVWKPEYMDAMSASKGAKATPLYTAPPQRKPLTDEEIDALPWNGSPRQFARAVERAHGIGEEK